MLGSSSPLPCRRSSPYPFFRSTPPSPGSSWNPCHQALVLCSFLCPPTRLSSQGSLQAFPWFYITKTSARAVRGWILIRGKEEGGRKAVPASDKDKIFLSELGPGVIGNRRAGAPAWWRDPCLSHKLRDKLEKKISLFFFPRMKNRKSRGVVWGHKPNK